MKCQILFPGKNKKSISKCRLLKNLPRVLSVKEIYVILLEFITITLIEPKFAENYKKSIVFEIPVLGQVLDNY